MIAKKQLHDALRGRIPPVRITFGYRIALFFVAMGMVLLPIIYLLLILAVGYGLFFFAGDPLSIWASDRSLFARVFVYTGPLFICSMLILFMVKPLFTKLEKDSLGVEVTREEEPMLFQFIELICEAIKAPVPKNVLLNCKPNASASFKHGVFSFMNNDLQLALGLPLISTMTVTRLGGILAHELGHFSQGAGMKTTHVVRSVNNWFYRVVFERDRWDERMDIWAEYIPYPFSLLIFLARAGVWISRKTLHGLLFIGNLISGMMLRQMEFDADRHEIRLAGTKEFIATTKNLSLVSAHRAAMYNNIYENWSNKKLLNNIPSYIAHKADGNNGQLTKAVEKDIEESRTRLFDTHPSDKERILNAIRENRKGVFMLDEPAVNLFKNFEQRSLVATTEFYIRLMGDDFSDDYLVDVERFREQDVVLEENNRALIDFYGETISVHFPVHFSTEKLDYAPEKTAEILKKISGFLTKRKEANLKLAEKKHAVLDDLSNLRAAEALLQLGFNIKPEEFNLSKAKTEEITEKLTEAAEREEKLDSAYKKVKKYVRPLPALLLNCNALSEDEKQRVEELVKIENQFSGYYPKFRKLLSKYSRFLILAMNMKQIEQNEEAMTRFDKLERTLNKELEYLYSTFEDVMHPFEKEGSMSAADFLFPDDLHEMNSQKTIKVMQTLIDLYSLLYCRVAGEIGVLSMNVMHGR